MAMLDISALQMGDVVSSGKGAKSVNLTQDGSQALFTLEPMEIAYEPSAFQDAESTRVNMVFRPTPEVEELLDSIDEWVMKEVAVNSVKLFGKARSAESLKDSYTSILKKSDKWPSQFKAKMNLQEPSKVKIWDADACLRDPPASWQGRVARPKLRLKSIYLMGTSFGPVLEVTDVQIIQEASAGSSCPF